MPPADSRQAASTSAALMPRETRCRPLRRCSRGPGRGASSRPASKPGRPASLTLARKLASTPVHDDIRTGADHRLRRTWLWSWVSYRRRFSIYQTASTGRPAAQTLARRDDVGLEVVVFTAQEERGAQCRPAPRPFTYDRRLSPQEGDSLAHTGSQRHNTASPCTQFQHDSRCGGPPFGQRRCRRP